LKPFVGTTMRGAETVDPRVTVSAVALKLRVKLGVLAMPNAFPQLWE
jgi:hypothetical protein